MAFANEPDGPRTISELPEVVTESAPIDPEAWNRLEPRAHRIDTLPPIDRYCPHCLDAVSKHDETAAMCVNSHAFPAWQQLTASQVATRKPTTLTAAEVTEPGWYWYRKTGAAEWSIVHADKWLGPFTFTKSGGPVLFQNDEMPGTFIGPLRAPAT